MSDSSEGHLLLIVNDAQMQEFLSALLIGEGYTVKTTGNQKEAFEILAKETFNVVVCDFSSPGINGMEVCKHIRGNFVLRHLSIILLMTSSNNPMDKIKGIYSGADDYINHPPEPAEFLARIKATIVRMARDLEANPLTKLPGNVSILKELEERVKSKAELAVAYTDLNKFKEFNDCHGFSSGDKVIYQTAQIIVNAVEKYGHSSDFVGHIGGDDFIFITKPANADAICSNIVKAFDSTVISYYSPDDLKKGYVITKNRAGELTKTPLLSISIGVTTNENCSFSHIAEITQRATELKSYAKSIGGSIYIKDRRKI